MKISENLTGKLIRLRNYKKEDMEFVSKLWNDEENGKYMSDPEKSFITEEYRKALLHLEDSKDALYLIGESIETGERLSTLTVSREGNTLNIGYCVLKSQWKKGIAAEMLELLIDFAKREGITVITAEIADENIPSRALVTKFGFYPFESSAFTKWGMDVSYKSKIYRLDL